MPKSNSHKWMFTRHMRRGAYGWRSSRLAAKRLKEAVSEIRKVARQDPVTATEGAIKLISRLSPAFEQVDDSWGILGTAVRDALAALAPVIGSAPADEKTREKWLRTLFEASQDDDMGYIDFVTDLWGTFCGSAETASRWADELLPITRQVLSPERVPGEFFHGTSACLSALLTAGRYEEIVSLLKNTRFWSYRAFGVDALAAMGRVDEALEFAEASRSQRRQPDGFVDADDIRISGKCETVLLEAGRAKEAYERYGLATGRGRTMVARFREIAKRYPEKDKRKILGDLIGSTPGEEGKWFATAHQLGFHDLALELADRHGCDPKTLKRAADKNLGKRPEFALGVALAALRALFDGRGYDITVGDILGVHMVVVKAAAAMGVSGETAAQIREMLDHDRSPGKVVGKALRDHRRV